MAATPRRSRCISGPGRVVWKDGISDPRPEDRKAKDLTASVTVPKMGARCGSELLAPVATHTLQDSVLAARPDLPSERTSVVRAALKALGSQGADLEQKAGAIRARRGLPEAKVVIPSRQTTTTIPTEMSIPDRAPLYGLHHNAPIHPVSLPPIISSPRTLRRKHHMTFPRQKSTRSLRSRAIAMSSTQPVPGVSAPRLGHPSRPYYTAIRPHLSKTGTPSRPNTPTTPNSAPATSIDTRQSFPSPPPGRPSFEFTRPRRSTTSGWSVSGEIELQIALSQRREEEEGLPYGSGKRGSIAQGVRKLGTGLRNLVLRRS